MFINTESTELPQIYQLLVNGVIPRPIAWVSTIDEDGKSNLAPYSFFSVASVKPPVLSITTVPAQHKPQKDTLQNIANQKEAVVHIVTEEFADSMNASCADYPAGISEIDTLGLQTESSKRVQPPSIAGTKVRYECKLREIIEVEPSPGGGVLILLDVIGTFVDDSVFKENTIDPTQINVLGKLGGNDYSDTQVSLSMSRPQI